MAGQVQVKERRFKKHQLEELRGRTFIYSCTFILLLLLAAIIYFIASRGLATFFGSGVNVFEFLFSTTWAPGRSAEAGGPSFGGFAFLFGSFAVTLMAALVSAPLGIGAAIFMAEIRPTWGKRILQPAIELLVGIPSVVYGFVGLTLIVPFLRASFPGLGFGLLAGTIVLSIMILPTITSVAYDAIKSLSPKLKEASYGLGATRWQTIRSVLVPAALPGLLTGVVLGMARAFGEALAVQMVIGNAQRIPSSLTDPTSTITSLLTLEMGNTVSGTAYNNALWSMALLLLLMSLLFIFLIKLISRRSRA